MSKRKIFQMASLLLFGLLVYLGRIQVWLALFLATLLLTPFRGRIYCGTICPINSLMEASRPLAKKKRIQVPRWLKSPFFRYLALVLLIATMVLSTRAGKKLPLLPLLTALGVLLSLVFDEALWHRYLCPYGTLLSLAGRIKKKGYHVEPSTCVGCQKCLGVCPAHAITMVDKKALIDDAECLVCGACERVCPTQAITRRL